MQQSTPSVAFSYGQQNYLKHLRRATQLSMFSATDTANFLACHHLLSLDRAEAAGQLQKPFFRDPGLDLLKELGIRHEAAFFRYLTENRGIEIVTIPTNLSWGKVSISR